MWRKLFLTSFVILVQEGMCLTGERECPESEDVHPCYCYYLSGHVYLSCQNFTDSEALRRIFTKSQRYEFTVVVIEDAMLDYLPHEIIDSVKIRELQLKKTTLQHAFDQTPLALDSLHALIIDDIRIESDQKLREIPDCLFSQMPNLSIVSFKRNQIAIISERAFERDITGKISIFLNENPLKCDCQMIWLVQKKPRILQGKCENPKRFHGKELNELRIQDFNC